MTTEMAPIQPADIDAMTPIGDVDAIVRFAGTLDTRIATIEKIKTAAIKKMHPWQFVNFGGKPYVWGRGVTEAIAFLGLQISLPRFKNEDGDRIGDDYYFEVMVAAFWPVTGSRFVGSGDSNTTDEFWNGSDKSRATYNKMLATCNNDIAKAKRTLVPYCKKAAIENAMSRLVSDVLGIRGAPWEHLTSLNPSLHPDKVEGFGGFGKGATSKPKSSKPAAKTVKIGELLKLPKDSVVAVGGTLSAPLTLKGLSPKAWHTYSIKDETGSVDIGHYCKDKTSFPDEATPGNYIHFPEVKVDEFQGRTRFVCWGSVELPTGAPSMPDEPGANDEP